MANIFDNMIDGFAQRVAEYVNDGMAVRYGVLGKYVKGDHRKQLKTKQGQQDDNVIQNFTGLAVSRSVSRVLKGGVEFQLPDGATEQQTYIDELWDLNNKDILLNRGVLYASSYGTGFLKTLPDQKEDPYTKKLYPRLIALDPNIIRIKVDPQDKEKVTEYHIEYTVVIDNQKVTFRELTTLQPNNTWKVVNEKKEGSAAWQTISSVDWNYDFPPIIHWMNLPSLDGVYGEDDISDVVNIQDSSNFVMSNRKKIVKHYAHPQTIGTGFSIKNMETIDNAVGVFRAIPDPNAKVFNLEMNSDLASSNVLGQVLRQSIFDISREVDITSLADKLGQLTNFGLRVLYTDALNKNETKRELFGEMLEELNRRLLVLAGYEGNESYPGEVVFGEDMEINISEELTADKMALDMGIVDEETVAKRYLKRYGVTWEDIKKRLDEKKRNQPNTPDTQPNTDNSGTMQENQQKGQQ